MVNRPVRRIAVLALVLVIVSGTVLGISRKAVSSPMEMRHFLVGFSGSADEALVRAHGGVVKYRYSLIPALAVTIPENAVARLRNAPGVLYVEPDMPCRALADTVPWGISRSGCSRAYSEAGWDGDGIRVAILDTGIDLDHPDLNVAGGATFVSGTTTPDDDNGHGTHVAGTVAALANGSGVIGCAPAVELYAVKVLNSQGSGWTSDLVAGIDWAVSNGMDIINMSLGCATSSSALEQACNSAYSAGVLLVAAAGNEGTSNGTGNNVLYPARYDSCIAVAAIGSNNLRASFSSTGPAVELAAPGVNVYSTARGGSYTTMSGTSMAAPHVSGLAAQIWASSPSLTNAQVRGILTSTAASSHDLGAQGRDSWYGYGLICGVEAAGLSKYVTCSVSTDSSTYNILDPVMFIVSAADQCSVGLRSASVAVSVTGPLTSGNYSGTTDQNGYWTYSTSFHNPGSYSVTTQVSKQGYGSSEHTCGFEVTDDPLIP